MTTFQVNDMTCGHCVATITKALKAVDADAVVQIDLAAHRVDVASSRADAVALGAAISDAGYTPETVVPPQPQAGAKAGGCGGGCSCGFGGSTSPTPSVSTT